MLTCLVGICMTMANPGGGKSSVRPCRCNYLVTASIGVQDTRTSSSSQAELILKSSVTVNPVDQPSYQRDDNYLKLSPINERPEKLQDGRTCSCFLKRRLEKGTDVMTPVESVNSLGRASIFQDSKAGAAYKKGCNKCCTSRRETLISAPTPTSIGKIYQCRKASYVRQKDSPQSVALELETLFDNDQVPSRVNVDRTDLTPAQIMNSWMPSKERASTEGFLVPSEKYIDVSPRDFSLRKYFPEYFLSKAEKDEIRAERSRGVERGTPGENHVPQLYDMMVQEISYSSGSKCPQGSCGGNEIKVRRDWNTMITDSATGPPYRWRDEELALARERDQVADEESSVPITSSQSLKRTRRWWSCRKIKHGKKSDKQK